MNKMARDPNFRAMNSQKMHILLTGTSYPRDALDWRGVFIR